ncbi:MAG: DUF2860 domain-containing protein [Gammaproteobacteria bacterium]|nr:DUF2860 domain-containing protein [Gammaproteobacteria bacterium]
MKTLFITAFLTLGAALFADTLWADIDRQGWNGSIGLVLGGVSSENQLDAYSGKKRIESLTEAPLRFDYDFLLPEIQLGYTFQNNITLFMDGSLLDGGGSGIRYTFSDKTRLSLSIPLFLGISGEVWQDPYLIQKERRTTDARLDGAIGISLDNIWGTYASIHYLYQDIAIKNDGSGESLKSRLTAAEIEQLRRSNRSHSATISLPPFSLGHGLYLVGGANYTDTDAQGEANSFTSQSVDLTLAYEKKYFEFFAHIAVGEKRYRAVNPIFAKKHESDFGTVAAGITFWHPFNWQNSSLELLIAVMFTLKSS